LRRRSTTASLGSKDTKLAAFEAKQKELEGKLMALIQVTYQAEAGGPSGSGGFLGSGAGGFPGNSDE
jgi:hypothetical protein